MREYKDNGRNGAPQKRPNCLTTAEDVQSWRDIVGEQNFQACLRAIADGAQLWAFSSDEEIDACEGLSESEKATVRRNLAENPEKSLVPFAGFVKPPLETILKEMSPTERLLNGIKEYPSGGGGNYQSRH